MNPLMFTDPAFLFFFAPLTVTLCWLLPAQWRNAWLLLSSLALYAWGETKGLPVLAGLIVLNWAAGVAMARFAKAATPILWTGITCNLGPLVWFKYAFFLIANLNLALRAAGVAPLPEPAPVLPAGLSFYAFMGISYLVDLRRRDLQSPVSPLQTGVYLALFPHLVAGPIWRMSAVLEAKGVQWDRVGSGARRFIIGLGKKMLIANALAVPVDTVFAMAADQIPASYAWLALICFTLQIYFDFSGYTDMAIGLGRMVGFELPENFRYPYTSRSVADFWRRWHITLSQWLRDYVYFPLGVRGRAWRRIRNQLLVFVLCGLWHGAAWQFLAWGLWHGAFLSLEQWRPWRNGLNLMPGPLRTAYTLAAVGFGWVFFRSESTHFALSFFKSLAGLGGNPEPGFAFWQRIATPALLAALGAGIAGAAPLAGRVRDWSSTRAGFGFSRFAEACGLCVVFLVSLGAIAGETFHAFLYFRF